MEPVGEEPYGVVEVHKAIIERPFGMYRKMSVPNPKLGGWPAFSAPSIVAGSPDCSWRTVSTCLPLACSKAAMNYLTAASSSA